MKKNNLLLLFAFLSSCKSSKDELIIPSFSTSCLLKTYSWDSIELGGNRSSTATYEYDNQSKLQSIKGIFNFIHNSTNNQDTETSETIYKYDKDGFLIEKISKSNRLNKIDESITTYEYKDGKLVKELNKYNPMNSAGYIIYENIYEYEGAFLTKFKLKSSLSTLVGTLKNGKIVSLTDENQNTSITEFEINSLGFISKKTTTIKNALYPLVWKYFYDKKGRQVKQESYSGSLLRYIIEFENSDSPNPFNMLPKQKGHPEINNFYGNSDYYNITKRTIFTVEDSKITNTRVSENNDYMLDTNGIVTSKVIKTDTYYSATYKFDYIRCQ
jgi:hypothetical protein